MTHFLKLNVFRKEKVGLMWCFYLRNLRYSAVRSSPGKRTKQTNSDLVKCLGHLNIRIYGTFGYKSMQIFEYMVHFDVVHCIY